MHQSFVSRLKPFLRPPVIGAAFCALLVISPVLFAGKAYLVIYSLAGLVIVAGGVIASAFMSFESADVRKALQAIIQMFKETQTPETDLRHDMMRITAWASVLKEKGMRNFETLIGKSGMDDPFVTYGLNMVVSEYKPEDVRTMLQTAADASFEHDSVPADILQTMTSHAPAFGMVGTLVGMVAMLCNLSGDMAEIGASLAVAFLSTLYGVLSARMVFMPAATRLSLEIARRHFRHHLITEGLALLASGKPPMQVQDHLNSFLKPEARDYYDYFKTKPNIVPLTAANAMRALRAVNV